MCISTGILIHFFSRSNAPIWTWEIWPKLRILLETRQRNSTETAQQNFVKLCSYEGHNFSRKCWFNLFKEQLISLLKIWPKLFCETKMNLVFCPITRHLCLELPFIVYSIFKQCWSVGYVSLLTLSFMEYLWTQNPKQKKGISYTAILHNFFLQCLSYI